MLPDFQLWDSTGFMIVQICVRQIFKSFQVEAQMALVLPQTWVAAMLDPKIEFAFSKYLQNVMFFRF